MINLLSRVTRLSYKYGLKPLLFQIDPELVHTQMTHLGEWCGNIRILRQLLSTVYASHDSQLTQQIAGITFINPVGLAAGFDYEARLTQILPGLGFGFGTVGTITHAAYAGNPKPLLGRLPKSKSLMVNKGFKNEGATIVAQKLKRLQFQYPVGISIGRTNSLKLKTQKQSIADIIQAFQTFEKSKVENAYYELNISCPNLFGDITFYPPKNLRELLTEVTKLKLRKPVFVKMPIEKENQQFLAMLEVIVKFPVAGVIIGNLQKNRRDPSLYQDEVSKFPKGNFSGKPCWNRSNELIRLCYKRYGKKLTIIGCGGVFSSQDAYIKIKLGAALIQMITGMIYEGPQIIGEINQGLIKLLRRDRFKHISQAIGIG